ncbi:hypothetical protein BH23VER1_BH23VER1_32930 [soil metagenome]
MNFYLAFVGGHEMIFIFLLLLLLFGAKKLPGLARGIGQSLGEFKKARKEFEDEIHLAQDLEEDVSLKPKRRPVDVSTAPKSNPTHPADPVDPASKPAPNAAAATAAENAAEPEAAEPVGAKANKATVQ